MRYEEAVHYIEEVPKFTKKTTLAHTRKILECLGSPEKELQVIHVAGTNGKGSVCAYLNSMLTEGGYVCGLFTSPHLIRINERFMISGEPVDDRTFLDAFQKVMEASRRIMEEGESHPTYFEILFLMGMVIFRERKVDYVILETGLGGRLDATNVVENPLACIITSISRDHTEYLGDTIAEIAGEKRALSNRAYRWSMTGTDGSGRCDCGAGQRTGKSRMGSDRRYVYAEKKDPRGYPLFISWLRRNGGRTGDPICAEYQMMNASLAYFTMKKLEDIHGISEEKLIKGIRNTSWPAGWRR